MTLSDSFCVDRYRDEFLDLMRSGTVDIVFANESELKSLYQTASFEAALDAIRKDCKLAAVTRSEKGSVIVRVRRDRRRPGDRGSRNWSTRPGAGDLYAAGFLHRLHQRARPAGLRPARLAGGRHWCIQQIGPRPRQNLRARGRAGRARLTAVRGCPRGGGRAAPDRAERPSHSAGRRRGPPIRR